MLSCDVEGEYEEFIFVLGKLQIEYVYAWRNRRGQSEYWFIVTRRGVRCWTHAERMRYMASGSDTWQMVETCGLYHGATTYWSRHNSSQS